MASQCGAIKRLRAPAFAGVVVDGFNFQSPDDVARVLTHFHADHYCGLTSSYGRAETTTRATTTGDGVDASSAIDGRAPKIYCSKITARLVIEVLGVRASRVEALEVGETTILGDTEIEVTFIDANHCPGACLVFFRNVRTNETLLHTGDFRAARRVREDVHLARCLARCVDGGPDEVHLDTTYCEKKWTFPDQDVVLEAMRKIAEEESKREPRTLFLCGSYSVGKERAIRAVCQGARTRASVTSRRKRSLVLSEWWRDDLFVCEDDNPEEAARCRVRVCGLGKGSNHRAMMDIIKNEAPRWGAVVAFSPTGWSYRKSMEKDGEFRVEPWIENEGRTRTYAVPYSEHSSYTELREFIKFLKPKRITPTVNASTENEREKLVNKHFLDLVDLKYDVKRIDFYFKNGGVAEKKQKTSDVIVVIDSEDEQAGDDEVKVKAEVISALDGDVDTIRRQQELWKSFRTISAKKSAKPLEPFPLECVAVVRSGAYEQFRSRAHVEQRLKELGATVMSRVTSNVTHIVVPNKGELATEAARLSALREMDEYKDHPSALRVTEAWLMRHVRARANNVAPEHSDSAKAAHEMKKREEKLAKAAAAKRKREAKKLDAKK